MSGDRVKTAEREKRGREGQREEREREVVFNDRSTIKTQPLCSFGYSVLSHT